LWYFNEVISSAKLTVVPSSDVVTMKNTILMAPTVTAGGYPMTDYTITWESGDTSVATVSADGVVTPVKPGQVYIKATLATLSGNAVQGISVELPITVVSYAKTDSTTTAWSQFLHQRGAQESPVAGNSYIISFSATNWYLTTNIMHKGDAGYKGLSGVEGDFVELPSQIMENWAFATPMLKQYAVHYRRGEVMPDDMIRRIHESAKFNEGFNTTELVAAALSDLDIHSVQSADKIDVAEFERQALTEKRGLIPQIEPRYHYTYFSHIFDGGYSAGYYFYIWAEVLDKDAYQAFIESGDIFDRATAERFRREILSKGGTRAGMDMYRAFRGAEPDNRAMLEARGLYTEEESFDEDLLLMEEIIRVDTRAQARQRAERSRREREAARLQAKMDSLNAVAPGQAVEPQDETTPQQLGLEPIKSRRNQ
jgi:hypothetical protein